jgi:hypothetical protein
LMHVHLHALDRALSRRAADQPEPYTRQLPLQILPAVLEEPLDAWVWVWVRVWVWG